MTELIFSRSRSERRPIAKKAGWRRFLLSLLDERIGWSGVLLTVGAVGLGFLLVFSLVRVRSEAVHYAKEMSVLSERVRSLEMETEDLSVQWQVMRSPERLEKLAPSLNLAAPKPEQVVVIGETR
ncbi:MAG: hypothetical protein GX444_19800 [Myxococcales bacterium]|nr:hypothetical protein [Myxococcales bacterium]